MAKNVLAVFAFSVLAFSTACSGSSSSSAGACGASGESCCMSGSACTDGLTCQSGTCHTLAACGASGEACCTSGNACATGLICQSGTCQTVTACGAPGEACCASGSACTTGLTCQDGACQSGPSSLTVFAGVAAGEGSLDGTGSVAMFYQPYGLAVDGSGNVYVADSLNNTIRKITPAGVVTTLAGTAGYPGSVDGTGSAARFDYPSGVAADGSGNVYVADTNNCTIRKITPAGVVTTLAGTAGQAGSADGTGSAAKFDSPTGVAVDSSGNVYVADGTIRKITPAGVVTTLAGTAGQSGSADGTGSAARFYSPAGVAVDGSGNVYVADTDNNTIRKITPTGIVTTLAGTAGQSGSADGAGSAARFWLPFGVAVDGSGNVYVVDTYNQTIRKITAAGVVTTLAGVAGQQGSADGTNSAARFEFPYGVAVDGSGNVYVADSLNNTIRKSTAAGAVTTFAGTARQSGSADGTGSAARFYSPAGVAVDGSGNVYVADTDNNTIRKITPTGIVTTLAGMPGQTSLGSKDGTGSAARFWLPFGVAVDGSGNVYVADGFSNSIRKITAAGVVTTLAGDPQDPFEDPGGVAVDGSGTVYVADSANNAIRKITAAGVVTTLAGGTLYQGGSADGTGSAARFNTPKGVAVDSSGTVYVADTGNNTIRKITPAAEVTTLAGVAGQIGSSDGTGSAARFYAPNGVAVDGFANVYVADTKNNTIRKITPAGVVTTLVGVALQGGTVVGPLPATLFHPAGVAVDPTTGNFFIVVPDAVLEARF